MDGRLTFHNRIGEGLFVIQELRYVRVLDPIPTKPGCVVSFLDDSGLLTSARIDELRFVNLSSQATIRCASAASGHTRARAKSAPEWRGLYREQLLR
jgi:hypothetical protein